MRVERRRIEGLRVGDGPSVERSALEVGLGPVALRRAGPTGSTPSEIGRGRGGARTIALGAVGDRALSLSRAGRFLLDGRVADGKAEGLAIYGAAQLSAGQRGGLFGTLPMNAGLREKLLANLTGALESTAGKPASILRDKTFAGAATLLINLARRTSARTAAPVREGAIDAVIAALDRSKNLEHVGFYLNSLSTLEGVITRAQKARLKELEKRVLPESAPVEEWTAGRTKPLEVRHSIHDEFWKEEIAFFSKKNGFTEVKRNAKDTLREYVGTLKDPSGVKPPLSVHVVVEKRELDYLESLSDPNVHVVLYSGHSSLGGNGSQAIQAAPAMRGPHPKLLFAANCRGKDNYSELSNKAPSAHIISTEHPTYSTSGQARVSALFAMLARGETYRWMREQTEEAHWDEPANNYFYPDQMKKFRFMDADEDGLIDGSILGPDALFDVERDRAVARAGPKFLRALNFANSELFYHWEVEAEHGKRSQYGKKYSDSLVAAGPLAAEKPGQLVRLEPVGDRFAVRFAPKAMHRMDQNVLAGHVTAQSILSLAKMRDGEVTQKEALRAVLMGAQAIHYLDVYEDSSPRSVRRYFKDLGLADAIDPVAIEHLFAKYDTHANDEQVAALDALLREKHGYTGDWTPNYRGAPL